MKKIIALLLALIFVSGAFSSCALRSGSVFGGVSVTSSDAFAAAEWLSRRLGDRTGRVVVGTDASSYGIDLSGLEDDGFILRSSDDGVLIFAKSADGLDLACRKYAKAVESGERDFDMVYHEGFRVGDIRIAGRSISDYTVLIPGDANENMKFAAGEMTRLVRKACGAELCTVTEEEPGALYIEYRFAEQGPGTESFRYFVDNGRLVFECAKERGASNATYYFLENECGWDYLSFGDSDLREATEIDIPDGLDKSVTPAFEYYRIFTYSHWDDYVTDRATMTSAQNSFGYVERAVHGLAGMGLSLPICLSDDDVFEDIKDVVFTTIDSRLAGGQVIGEELKYVDISYPDSYNFCSCRNCRMAMIHDGYTYAGLIVRFANRMSAEVNGAYPGDRHIKMLILGYMGTYVPPKNDTVDEDVYVTFAPNGSCSNHPFDGSGCEGASVINQASSKPASNVDFSGYLEKWCSICDNVYMWYYCLAAGINGWSCLDNMYEDIRYFRSIGVKGLFWQLDRYDPLDIVRVEQQLGWHLIWDPDMTKEEFDAYKEKTFRHEYGDAADAAMAYADVMNAAQNISAHIIPGGVSAAAVPGNQCWHCWYWGDPVTLYYHDPRYFADHFEGLAALFDAAIPMADSARIERRTELLASSALYQGLLAINLAYPERASAGHDALAELYEVVLTRLRKNGVDPQKIYTVDNSTEAIPSDYDGLVRSIPHN